MKQKLDAPVVIVAVGIVLMIGSRVVTWWPGVIVGAVVILGGLASAAAKRRPKA